MKAARIGLPFFCRACSLLLEYAQGSRKAADKLENGQSGCGGSLAINPHSTQDGRNRDSECNGLTSPTINFRIKIPVKPLRPIGLPVTVSKRGPRSLSRGAAPI